MQDGWIYHIMVQWLNFSDSSHCIFGCFIEFLEEIPLKILPTPMKTEDEIWKRSPRWKTRKLSTNHQFLLGFTQTGPVFFLPKSRNGPKPELAELMNFAIFKGLRWRFESKLRQVLLGMFRGLPKGGVQHLGTLHWTLGDHRSPPFGHTPLEDLMAKYVVLYKMQ